MRRNWMFTSPFCPYVGLSFGYIHTTIKNGVEKTRDFTLQYERVFPGIYKKTHEGKNIAALDRLKAKK